MTVHGASVPHRSGGRMSPEPADKMSAPHFQIRSQASGAGGDSLARDPAGPGVGGWRGFGPCGMMTCRRQLGHTIRRPASCSSHWSRWRQCGQWNLKSLMQREARASFIRYIGNSAPRMRSFFGNPISGAISAVAPPAMSATPRPPSPCHPPFVRSLPATTPGNARAAAARWTSSPLRSARGARPHQRG